MVSLDIFSTVPPTEPCALRSTHPLKVSTRDFSWGKGGRCVWLTTFHPCSAERSRKSGALIYPEPLGPLRPVVGHLYFNFTHCLEYFRCLILVCSTPSCVLYQCSQQKNDHTEDVYIYIYIYIYDRSQIYDPPTLGHQVDNTNNSSIIH